MSRQWTMGFLGVALAYGVATVGLAAEHGGMTMDSSAAPQASSTAPAAASTATTASAPAITTAEGSITALNLKGSPATLTLTGTDGKVWTVGIATGQTTVWNNGQASTTDALKVGEHIRVRATAQNGSLTAKSIQVLEAPKATSTSTKPY